MLIAIAVICTLCEAVFTALEVALGAVSRARLRTLIETERALQAASPTTPGTPTPATSTPDAAPVTAPPAGAGHAATGPATASRAVLQRAVRTLRVLENRKRLTLLFITVTSASLWAATVLLTWQSLSAGWPQWVLPLALIGVLFVAEALPLLLAARNPEAVALRGSGIVELCMAVLAPLLTILGGLGHGMARLLGAGPGITPQVTEGELRTALATAEEEGVIESEERAMLEGAMDFRDKQVREVMTPRIDISGVPAEANLVDVLAGAMRGGHSRLPVYEGTLDKIVGIVAAKDLIPYLRATQPEPQRCARDIMRPAYFVPENKFIAPTLEELRHQRTLMAIVVDADGGTAGLVTLEDLLEQIVGDIQDEYDPEEEPALRVVTPVVMSPQVVERDTTDSANSAESATGHNSSHDEPHTVVSGAWVTVRHFERFWKKSFHETVRLHAGTETADASQSLAAWALHLFDGVPHPGDHARAGSIVSPKENPAWLKMEVLLMDGPRIEELQFQKIVEKGE